MIRLPSVIHVIRSARETAQRFPWVLLSATTSACLSWVLVVENISNPSREELLSRCLLVAMLGISGFLALAIGLEQSPLAPRRHWIGLAAGAVVLIPFFFSYNQETCSDLRLSLSPIGRRFAPARSRRPLLIDVVKSPLFGNSTGFCSNASCSQSCSPASCLLGFP